MEAERAEQHAKRLRAERQRKVKDKMKKMGGKFSNVQEEYRVELRGSAENKNEKKTGDEFDGLNKNAKVNQNQRNNNRNNQTNPERNTEEWEQQKQSIIASYEEQFNRNSCIEVRVYGNNTHTIKGRQDYSRFSDQFKQKYPCDEYETGKFANFVSFLNFEKSFLIRFDQNASEAQIDKFIGSFPDKDKIEISDGVLGNIVRTNYVN